MSNNNFQSKNDSPSYQRESTASTDKSKYSYLHLKHENTGFEINEYINQNAWQIAAPLNGLWIKVLDQVAALDLAWNSKSADLFAFVLNTVYSNIY